MLWVSSGWEKIGWGFWSIHSWTGSATLAYRRDGGSVERYTQKNYKTWLVAEPGWDRTQIRFPAEQNTIDIDHVTREYRVRSVVPGGLTVWDASDSDCSKMAVAFDLSDLKRNREGLVAGINCIRYTGVSAHKERVALWLAPSLGCTQMLVIRSGHNALGSPVSYSRIEAVSVQIGEPDSSLFAVPRGYRNIH